MRKRHLLNLIQYGSGFLKRGDQLYSPIHHRDQVDRCSNNNVGGDNDLETRIFLAVGGQKLRSPQQLGGQNNDLAHVDD